MEATTTATYSAASVESIAGSLSGISFLVASHPFDRVKTACQFVMMKASQASAAHQRAARPVTARRCAVEIYKRHGIKGFFQGMLPLVASAAVEAGAAFTTFSAALSVLTAYSNTATVAFSSTVVADSNNNNKSTAIPEGKTCPGTLVIDHTNASTAQVFVAGMAAGCATTCILTPAELIKNRLMLQPKHNPYKGTLDCVVRTIQEGGVRSFGRGAVATLAREVPGIGAYFATYHLCLRTLQQNAGDSAGAACPSHLAVPLSGAAAGVAYCLAFYPADVVKTLIQTDAQFAKLSLQQALLKVYRTSGVRGLFAGCAVSCVRQVPGSIAQFGTYELVKGQM